MQLTRAVDRYTAALGLFSPAPAPSSWQLQSFAPGRSMESLSPDSIPSGLGDMEGVFDAAIRAASRVGATLPGASAAVRPGAVAMLPGLGRRARSQYANVLNRGLGGRVTKFGSIGRIMPSMRPRATNIPQAVVGGMRSMTGMSKNLGDLEDFWDDLKSAGGAAGGYLSGKVDELDKALKIIIGLSGVAAITGIITVLRK